MDVPFLTVALEDALGSLELAVEIAALVEAA